MKKIKLVHNPNAGDGNYTAKELISLVEAAGFSCTYSSTHKSDWKMIESDIDIILIAGGDGTVRKLVGKLMENELGAADIPIGLLNLGTANNLARALNIKGEPGELIEGLEQRKPFMFDIGKIKGLPQKTFFLESMGLGIFPELMKDIKGSNIQEMHEALLVMKEMVKTFPPVHCEIEMNGREEKGNYILAEVMNTPWMGPGLHLNSQSDPGDGRLEIVLVKEEERDEFLKFLEEKLADGAGAFTHHSLQGEKLAIKARTKLLHADDRIIELDKRADFKINVLPGAIQFLA